jgi:hypothetical protein
VDDDFILYFFDYILYFCSIQKVKEMVSIVEKDPMFHVVVCFSTALFYTRSWTIGVRVATRTGQYGSDGIIQ